MLFCKAHAKQTRIKVAEQNESYDSEGTDPQSPIKDRYITPRGRPLQLTQNTLLLLRRASSDGFAGQAPHFGRFPFPRSFVLCSESKGTP